MDTAKVNRKGQVTIPKHLREKYKIDDKVSFVDADDGILVKPVPKISDIFGILKVSKIDIARMREEDRRSEAARGKRLEEIFKRSKRWKNKRAGKKERASVLALSK